MTSPLMYCPATAVEPGTLVMTKEKIVDLLMETWQLVCLTSTLTSTHLLAGVPPAEPPEGLTESKGGCLKTPFSALPALLTKSAETPALGKAGVVKPSKSA